MSCTMYWRPIRDGEQVGDTPLRNAIDRRYGTPKRLTIDHMEFLRGLDAAGIEGASDLIEAIEKHEEIEVYLEC